MPPPQGTPQNFLEHPSDYAVTSKLHNDTYEAIQNANLAGRAVFVSGASRGCGKAMLLSFARAGASKIAGGARNMPTALAQEVGKAAKDAGHPSPSFLAIRMDLMDAENVQSAAKQVSDAFGSLDIVVNNAGILPNEFKMMGETNIDEWWRVLTLNLRGPYLVSRYFVPLLLKDGSKKNKYLFNVSSVGALLYTPCASSYQVSKTALVKLTGHVQAEYGQQGITAISLHPGNILTDINNGGEGMSDEMKQVFLETTEISADTISYLASQASEWLGGRYVNVCWDMPELFARKDEIVKKDLLKWDLRF